MHSDGWKPDRLNYDAIRDHAEAFLGLHNPDREIPVPIEEIVEFHLGVNIVPLSGILDELGIDAFTSGDAKDIHVDQGIFEGSENRLRFSLAHEAGHITMHMSRYANRTYYKTEGWKRIIESTDEDALKWCEYQANSFAGLVLAPSPELNHAYRETLAEVCESLDLGEDDGFVQEAVAQRLAEMFLVSEEVIRRRLQFEGIPGGS